MTAEVRLAFRGGATIYQGDRKFETTATLFAEGDQSADAFFGHYDGAIPDGLESGPAVIRFSDGSEADGMLAAVDPTGAAFG